MKCQSEFDTYGDGKMKRFFKAAGFILLILLAVFVGEAMRSMGMEYTLNKYLVLVGFFAVAYYVNSLRDKLNELQEELSTLRQSSFIADETDWRWKVSKIDKATARTEELVDKQKRDLAALEVRVYGAGQ